MRDRRAVPSADQGKEICYQHEYFRQSELRLYRSLTRHRRDFGLSIRKQRSETGKSRIKERFSRRAEIRLPAPAGKAFHLPRNRGQRYHRFHLQRFAAQHQEDHQHRAQYQNAIIPAEETPARALRYERARRSHGKRA